ncbi:MAG: translation initiation factor IF-2, partial [Acidobacteria bacterium]
PQRGPIQDIRAYQRSLQPSEPVEAAKPSSERGRRRAQRKQDAGATARSAELPAFKEARPDGPVTVVEGMTVREYAEKLGVKSKDLIRALMMRGIMANINHVLDPETAKALADDLGVEVMEVSFEEEVQLQQEIERDDGDLEKAPRAPVVTVMGHVDHGKTTLLDAIRQSNVVAGEAGGITQHIGAYHVDVGDQKIVFLDTPGHEAFTLMRARGARVTDLVVLVVAADDGVMPQTIEAIDHARAAKVPIIVAINKIDKANANPDRVKKELADHELMVEEWGGDVVSVELSALKKEGIDELLEMILLQAELLELKASPALPAQGTVLEARRDVGRGIVATVLVQDGTLEVGDVFVAGSVWGKVRSMTDDRGERLDAAGPSTPVEVTGFNDLPSAGDLFQVVEDEAKARSITDFRRREERQRELQPKPSRMSLAQLFDRMEAGEAKELAVVLKADVQGSLEVVKDAIEKLSTDKIKIKVLHAGVGAITTNNVIFAAASDAIIIGFNVRPERKASALAEKEDVDIRLHTVIYELTDELKKAMAGLLEPEFVEEERGRAEVREIFKVPKIGTVAGCYVTEGVIPRNANVRLLRDNRVVYEGKIASLRRFKDDVAEVRSGFECGIGLEQFQDVKPGDVIEAFVRREVAPTL